MLKIAASEKDAGADQKDHSHYGNKSDPKIDLIVIALEHHNIHGVAANLNIGAF